jgi:hypothetical protein
LGKNVLGREGQEQPTAPSLGLEVYRNQVWPGLCHGVGILATQTSIMKSALHSLEFEMLPSLGVNRHVKREWQTIAREFGGIGLHSLLIEQFISWAELILQHHHPKLTVLAKI